MPETLKTVAYEYWKLGCSIVLLKSKKPLHEWAQWQNERQTEQEFNTLPWPEGNQYALICGTKLENGLFLGILDHDVKNLPEEIIQKGKQVLKQLPITRLEETPSGGLHLIFYSRTEPKSISAFRNECALELIGKGKLCIMAPSEGYKNLNDNTPTEVQDLETLFYESMSKAEVNIKGKEHAVDVWFGRQDLATKPYRKDDPPCIRQIKKGVSEGLRNETTIRLSSYLVNFRQLEPKKAFQELVFSNRLNSPPLTESELRSVFESTVKGAYNYGCEDSILKSFCKENVDCPIRKKQEADKNEKPVFCDAETDSRIESEVNRIIEADNQLETLTPYLDNIVVGETNIKKATATLLLSGKSPNPKNKQIIIFKSTEGAGKTTLMNILTEGYRVKDVGRFSEHALDYTNLQDFEILRLKELGAMDEEKQGLSTIKFLSSDDQGYTVEITVKNEQTGKFETEQHKIPPITTISSTIRLMLDSQFERRAWLFGLDESTDQTKQIMAWKAKRERQEAEKVLGLRKVTDFEFSREVYRRFIWKFEPKEIIIPFPSALLEILGYQVLRVRGDMDKLIIFVKLYGMLNVKRLQEIRENVFVLAPEVANEAIQIIQEPLAEMLARADARTKQLFQALDSLVDVEERARINAEGKKEKYEVEIRYNHKNAQINKAVRDRVAIGLGKSERTIRSYLSALENAGYLSGDNKKPKTFTLLYNISEIQKKFIGTLVKSESADSLICKMWKEAQEWLKTGLEIGFPRDGLSTEQASVLQTEPSPPLPISDSHLDNSQGCSGEQTQNNRQIDKLPNPADDNPRKEIVVTDSAETKAFVAGDCIHHWKPSCETPNFNVVSPTEPCPATCKAFLAKVPEKEE